VIYPVTEQDDGWTGYSVPLQSHPFYPKGKTLYCCGHWNWI